jgi:hypothetical protein
MEEMVTYSTIMRSTEKREAHIVFVALCVAVWQMKSKSPLDTGCRNESEHAHDKLA